MAASSSGTSWILAATVLGSSMDFIDGTVVNVALPSLQSLFGATGTKVQWVGEAYALFLSALLLIGGSVGDRFGLRNTFLAGVVLFDSASLWCGFAPSLHQLLMARCLQGVGGALLVPNSLALLSASFSGAERGHAIGTWSGFASMMTALGPVVGGWMVQHGSWRWVFFLNIPIGLATVWITLTKINLDVEKLLRERISLSDLDEDAALRLIGAVNGHPQTLSIVTAMAKSMSSDQLRRILSGNLYDLQDVPPTGRRDLARAAKPIVISANDGIIEKLKNDPKDVYKLTPRQYEELIADLLRDMGHEVTLTQATRDGGKDILASMKTDVGEFLCLVDAKRFREDRKIGVSMVRTLNGTLADYQASSAMLVTTSRIQRMRKPCRKNTNINFSCATMPTKLRGYKSTETGNIEARAAVLSPLLPAAPR